MFIDTDTFSKAQSTRKHLPFVRFRGSSITSTARILPRPKNDSADTSPSFVSGDVAKCKPCSFLPDFLGISLKNQENEPASSSIWNRKFVTSIVHISISMFDTNHCELWRLWYECLLHTFRFRRYLERHTTMFLVKYILKIVSINL